MEKEEVRGEKGVGFINEYMKGKVERQIILLHQLSAPVGGLIGKCPIMIMVGRTSNGKTTIGKLGQSFYGRADSDSRSTSMSGSLNALEKLLDGNMGVSYYFDDASIAERKFDWADFIYRLSSGKIRKRMNREYEVNGGYFCGNFLISSEISILDKIKEREKEGILGRVIEVPIEDNNSILFDNADHCERVQEFYGDNYGNIIPAFMDELFEIGIENVKEEVKKEKENIRKKLQIFDNIMQRHVETMAVMSVASDIGGKIGLMFDKKGILEYFIKCVQKEVRCWKRIEVMPEYKELATRLLEWAEERGSKIDGGNYFLLNKDFDNIVADFKNTYSLPCQIKDIDIKRELERMGVLMSSKNGAYSVPNPNNGKARGYMIRKKEEGENE